MGQMSQTFTPASVLLPEMSLVLINYHNPQGSVTQLALPCYMYLSLKFESLYLVSKRNTADEERLSGVAVACRDCLNGRAYQRVPLEGAVWCRLQIAWVTGSCLVGSPVVMKILMMLLCLWLLWWYVGS